MTLYSLRTADGSFRITKLDDDLNPEPGASYLVSPEACECPAGQRYTCRHRQMLPKFIEMDAVDSPLMYHFETQEFLDTSSVSDTSVEGLSERPMNPAVNELLDLAPEVSVLTEEDQRQVFNAVAEAVGQEEMKQIVPSTEAEAWSTILNEPVKAVYQGTPIIERDKLDPPKPSDKIRRI